tara:strand:+ start:240 stop:503 length:264 start_codon:yes stop_codon:yes gene_type:complete
MKKIKLTVASILLSGVIVGQSHWTDNKVVMEQNDHIEAINTIEDLIEWMNADIDNLVIDQEVGELYVENFQELLFRIKNKSILLEKE